MPKMTRAELMSSLKHKHERLRYMVLSGQANESSVVLLRPEKCLEEFIEEPWDVE